MNARIRNESENNWIRVETWKARRIIDLVPIDIAHRAGNWAVSESGNLKLEYIDEDPKDGELYLGRIKPGETLVEVRRDANVQIARRIWV